LHAGKYGLPKGISNAGRSHELEHAISGAGASRSQVKECLCIMFKLKRIYEAPSAKDGFRVLVERLWPRGISKEHAHLDLWLKDVAPSPELRKWFNHDPAKWKEFRERYAVELKEKGDAVHLLKEKAGKRTVTLVYAARDEEHNGALVLKRFLEHQTK